MEKAEAWQGAEPGSHFSRLCGEIGEALKGSNMAECGQQGGVVVRRA